MTASKKLGCCAKPVRLGGSCVEAESRRDAYMGRRQREG